MLEVTIYSSPDDDTPQVIECDFVSLVSNETYGPPALVAPNRNGQGPRAGVNDKVLYLSTALVPMFEIERKTSD